MSFSRQLRADNDDLFRAIFAHPFVTGIGEGHVPHEALAHYVRADYEYLTAFARIYGTAVSQCETREQAAFFSEQIDFVLNGETHPHNNFCDVMGVDYAELQNAPLPPTADHYVKHMLHHAASGNMGETLAVLLPCPWTYKEIAEQLNVTYQPTADHPFRVWIDFYADPMVADITERMCAMLDAQAEAASPVARARMQEAFRKSCQLEWGFWEMAYTGEQWPAERLASANTEADVA